MSSTPILVAMRRCCLQSASRLGSSPSSSTSSSSRVIATSQARFISSSSCATPTRLLCALPAQTSRSSRMLVEMPMRLRLFSSTTGVDRPHLFQLEHVVKRLEFTTPLFFKIRPDYTFYTKDVVLEDKIWKVEKQGLDHLRTHWGVISVLCAMLFPQINLEALNIAPILEDGTVRLRWRILYLTWLQFLNPKNFNPDHRSKNLKWYDGYAIFHVNSDGLVYRVVVQKVMPDEPGVKQTTKKIVQKFAREVLPNASFSPPTPSPPSQKTRTG